MKRTIPFLLTAGLFWMSCGAFHASYTTIAIEDYRNKPRPAAWPQGETPGTVKVYRETLVNPIYTVHFFRMDGTEMRLYSASYGSEADFSQAQYRWKNDSTVVIRLKHPGGGQAVRFTVWGSGTSTGIKTAK